MFTYKMKILTTIVFSLAFFASFSLAQVCTPTPSGLVAWYPGNGNANDISGNGNHGTLQNGATFAAGHVGQSFSFGGVDDNVQITSSGFFTNQPGGTIEAWVNPQGAHGDGVGAVFYEDTGVSGFTRFGVAVFNDGNVTAGGRDSSTGNTGTPKVATTVAGAAPLNTWTHVIGVWEVGVGIKIYINGVLSASLNDATLATFSANNAQAVRIGNLESGGNSVNEFNGLLDEITLYNRALTDAEITSIFNAGTAGKCTGTTAALVQISGRVTTANGRGIRNAIVSLTDSIGEMRTALTSSFGYYNFEDVQAGETYILEVQSKRYRFANASRVISVADALADADFMASP